MMFLGTIFFFVTILLLILPSLAWVSNDSHPTNMLTAANIALPGCPNKCGNVTIPYPFGIGRGCSFGDNYVIACKVRNSISVPEIPGRQILDISETQLKITARATAASCNPAETGSGENTWYNVNLTNLPYAVSPKSNLFVVIGCHHYGLLETQTTTHRKVASCVALCTRQEDLLDDKCSGIGCCVAPIPKGLQNTGCVDLDRTLGVTGYRCKCIRGYQGNPYLNPGCTDINECREEEQNPCSGICVNTPGSYKCHCLNGYYGDGRKSGTGCHPNSIKLIFYLGLGLGLGSILLFFVGFWIFIVARQRKERLQRDKHFKRNGGLLLKQQMSSKDGMIEKTRIFTSDELEKATDNFNEDRVSGQGGQGRVYKGMLSDGKIVAIKKSNIDGQSQLSQFINEVVILSQINHRNIVKLLGCCLETQVPLLVYEFVPNDTLSKHIHVPSEEFPVTWEMRLQIALDVAGALFYLHSASSTPIFHRDVKSSNILLDAKYRAKVSDFGTSRSIPTNGTHLTTCVQGTFGYLDPEYFCSHKFTEKSDVYSFGVVLVELLTGQKAIIPTDSPDGQSLVWWFLSTIEKLDLYEILAARVAKEGRKESIFATASLAKQCLNMDGRQRPTMREVALQLEIISQLEGDVI